MPVAPPPHRVLAVNPSAESENRIHADEVARGYGFRGGLVPGVVLWAYLTNPVVRALGREFLEHGWMRVAFARPVYEGDEIECTAEPEQAPTLAAPDRHDYLKLTLRDGAGELCAEGEAALVEHTGHVAPGLLAEAPLPDERPAASEDTLAQGAVLGSLRATFRAEKAEDYLRTIAEPLRLYAEERIAHPGWLIRFANTVLVRNVVLGPWIHVESTATHLGVVRDGDVVVTRAAVSDNYERKGHQFVDLSVQLTVDGSPVMRVHHRAIWQLRPPRDC